MVLESTNVEEFKLIQFNDENNLNAISASDWIRLSEEIQAFEESTLKYLVFKSVNNNFSAGANLGENASSEMIHVSNAAKKIWECKKPIISIVEGVVAGAASNLILLSDFIIATPDIRFIEVFARRGLVVDFGGSWILPKLVGVNKAKHLMMLAQEINGEDLYKLGLIYKLCSSDQLDTELKLLLEKLNKVSFISMCMIKDQIRKGLDSTFKESLDNETINQNKRFIHPDSAEGVLSFIEKRQGNFSNTLDE
jgi:enoyl-CoA hydratase/carnithine racemase